MKLKYVQQPVGKRAGSGAVIRPSKRIIYDTREAIVTFLSEDVDKCVDEFLEEWARVSKMVVIARESTFFSDAVVSLSNIILSRADVKEEEVDRRSPTLVRPTNR